MPMPTEDETSGGASQSPGGNDAGDDRVGEPLHGRERASTLNDRGPARGERGAASADREAGTADKAERDERGLRDRLEGLVPDIVRKTFYAGLGALFTTEEGIRKLTNDFSLPKDVANYLLSSADGAKDEVLRLLGRELHEFFARVNLSQELAKLLTQLSFEIKTEIRFIPNDEAVGGLAIK